MIIKNITFVISKPLTQQFLKVMFQATDDASQWIDEIKVFKITEEVDPASLNYAVQLSFTNKTRLDAFNNLIMNGFIENIQSGIPEPLLYFESHLEKVF